MDFQSTIPLAPLRSLGMSYQNYQTFIKNVVKGFRTFMCRRNYEVEGIMNARPITTISDDKNDPDALTPNHLLLARSNQSLPPGVFKKDGSRLSILPTYFGNVGPQNTSHYCKKDRNGYRPNVMQKLMILCCSLSILPPGTLGQWEEWFLSTLTNMDLCK